MTDRELAQLPIDIYQGTGIWDHVATSECIGWGVRRIEDVDVVVFRGSKTPQDWLLDFRAFAMPVEHGHLGWVHPGFCDDLDATWQMIRTRTSKRRVIVGHSLGAAHATICTALAVLDGEPPLARICWGEPKSGFQKLADLIKPVPARSYRNRDEHGHDDVTDVPLGFWPEQYVHASPLIDVGAGPVPGKTGLFRYHDMHLYAGATPAVAIC